jgi:hypothetical protein
MLCCGIGKHLLDKDQVVPAATDTYQAKYRFYFEEFTAQTNSFRVWWSYAGPAGIEYDIPKSSADCLDPRTPVEQCRHKITSHFKGIDLFTAYGTDQDPSKEQGTCMMRGDPNTCGNTTKIRYEDDGWFQLIYAAPHCHGPACERIELWNNDTGELLCSVSPAYGTSTDKPVDEAHYLISIPPCVWGYESGLQSPPRIHLNSNLTAIKIANNTYGHWGVMALWQMRAAYLPPARHGPRVERADWFV